MVVFVIASMIFGMAAAAAAFLMGFSMFAALSVYSVFGSSIMALLLVRALICLHLGDSSRLQSRSA